MDSPDDLSLIKPLADYPSMLEASAKALEPHRLTYYLQDLAGRLHTYYYKHRILPPVLEGELERHDTLKPLAAEGEPVGKPTETAVELRERLVVAARDHCEHRLVRQVRELAASAFRSPSAAPAQSDHPALSPVGHGATRRPPSPSAGALSSARRRRPVARA